MRISHRNKFVFLANPRTASTTIRELLDPYSDVSSRLISESNSRFPFYHHIPAKQLRPIFQKRGWPWDEYRKFCVVRNPYERMVSLYHHQQKIYAETESFRSYGGAVSRYGAVHATKMATLYMFRPRSFDDFIRRIDTGKALTISLKNFAFDNLGNQLIDDVLMFENIQRELPALLKDLGISIRENDIPRLNAAKRTAGISEFYTKESIEIMKVKFGYEIERFGYAPV